MFRFCLALAAGLIFLATGSAFAQGELPPPIPPGSSGPPGSPVLPQTIPIPQPGVQPAFQPVMPVPPPPPPFPPGGPALVPGGQPLVIRPPQPPGFFSAFEIGVVAPNIGGNLSSTVRVGGVNRQVSLPNADLDWTGTPRLELGYRFAQGIGSVGAAYRSVVSEGADDIPKYDPLGSAFLRSRMNLNAVDLFYASPEIPFGPLWDLQWNAGVRIATVYYDSHAIGQFKSQRTTNNFVGAGPRVGLDVRRHFDAAPGFSFFGHVETGVVIGSDEQSFSETRNLPGGTIGGTKRFSETESSPLFGLQLGLSYTPQHNPHWCRFTFGYQFEQWWGVGNAGSSSGDVNFQGLFFRGEFNF